MLEYLAGEMMNKKLLPLLTVAIVNFATAKSSNVLDFCLSKEVDKSSCLSSWLSKSDELLEHRGISNSNNGALFHSVFTGDYKETSIDSPNEIIAYRLKCSDKDEIYNFNYETNELFKYNINKDEVLHEIDKSHHELKIHLESEKKEKIIIDTFSTNDIQYYNSVISFFRILKALKLEQNIQNNQTLKDKIESKDQTILSMICEEAKSSKSITDSTNSIITNSRLIINDEKLIEKLDDLLLCCSELQGPEEGPKMYAMMNGMFSLLLGQNNDESSNEGEAPETLERRIVDQVQDIMNECCEKITSIGNFDHHLLTYALSQNQTYTEFTENHLNELTETLSPNYAFQMSKSIFNTLDLSCGDIPQDAVDSINLIFMEAKKLKDHPKFATLKPVNYFNVQNMPYMIKDSYDQLLMQYVTITQLERHDKLITSPFIDSNININDTIEQFVEKSMHHMRTVFRDPDMLGLLLNTLWNDYVKIDYNDAKLSDMIFSKDYNTTNYNYLFAGESNSDIIKALQKYINIINDEDDISITTKELTEINYTIIFSTILHTFDIKDKEELIKEIQNVGEAFNVNLLTDQNTINYDEVTLDYDEYTKTFLSLCLENGEVGDHAPEQIYTLNYCTNKFMKELRKKDSRSDLDYETKINYIDRFFQILDLEKLQDFNSLKLTVKRAMRFAVDKDKKFQLNIFSNFAEKYCCYIKKELPILIIKHKSDSSNKKITTALQKIADIMGEFHDLLIKDNIFNNNQANSQDKMKIRRRLGHILEQCSLPEEEISAYLPTILTDMDKNAWISSISTS